METTSTSSPAFGSLNDLITKSNSFLSVLHSSLHLFSLGGISEDSFNSIIERTLLDIKSCSSTLVASYKPSELTPLFSNDGSNKQRSSIS